MIKNIGKFKQWTGEKIGKSSKTRMDEDFNTLTDETEAKRVALEKLNETSQAYLKAISKRVEGADKSKSLAIETFGVGMSAQSHTLREGSTYRQALLRMGDAHQNMGIAQTELITRFTNSYIECLAKAQAQMKEYQTMQKKLQSRRLDYDAKLAKVQKAKKEKPEWEEEMQAAKSKYEDTRECVLGIMTAISDSEDDDVNSLKQYYDAQLAYARKMVEVLESIPESTFVCSPNGSQSSLHTKPLHRQCSRDTDDSHSVHSDDYSSYSKRSSLNRTPSTADLRRQSSTQHGNPDMSKSMSHLNPGSHQLRRNGSMVAPPPPPAPPTNTHQKQVRALYNFDATAEGELSIQKGDVIGIVEEIDEGWWIGELEDANGIRQEGMFPSNYCEEVMDSSSHRQTPESSNTGEPNNYMDEDEAAYYERETEPTIQYTEQEPTSEEPEHDAFARRVPPSTPARQIHAPVASPPSNYGHHISNGSGILGHAFARATPPPRPMSAVTPLQRASTIGSRVPPPPPPSRRTAVTTEGAPPPQATGPGTPSGHMGGYIPRDYFSAQSDKPAAPCRECHCDDFAPNVFKRGSCNNCFHTH
ncbi:hypothetical protein BG006_010686 [Podila minutissima]|uniref:BAR-domain-containing protein n=1 Tax=Podila minutissima TaxID=64525 RepID=A0A9P5SCZ0_9FUNG|nr:hypothetical protein BG006_010686 [Podila minutissima]